MKKFYNAEHDLTLIFRGQNFTLVGNKQDAITDEQIFDLYEGEPVEGWREVAN